MEGQRTETLFASTADDGSEQWTVMGLPTSNGLVRITSVNAPSVVDVSNGQFTISASFSLLTKLRVHDNGGDGDSLEWGTGAGATDGIDGTFGEYEQPPLPPTGVFDVRWVYGFARVATGHTGYSWWCAAADDLHGEATGRGRRISVRGEVESPGVARRDVYIAGWPGGVFSRVNMKQQDSLVISDEAAVQFQLVYDAGNTVNTSAEWMEHRLGAVDGGRQEEDGGISDIDIECVCVHDVWVCQQATRWSTE